MTIQEAVKERHSVRKYINKPLDENTISLLEAFINEINKESGLHIQLVKNEPKAFDSFLAHYGKFSMVLNYFAMVGKNDDKLEELVGYYGEKLVLYAQTLGLNTCWVALSYKKVNNAFEVSKGEKLSLVIAVGYGENNGHHHKSKKSSEVSNISEDSPEWFRNGIKYALLAPTAVNQQQFFITLLDANKVSIKSKFGPRSKVDLGIVKYHFELGAEGHNFEWE